MLSLTRNPARTSYGGPTHFAADLTEVLLTCACGCTGVVQVVESSPSKVVLGFAFPAGVRIDRSEIVRLRREGSNAP